MNDAEIVKALEYATAAYRDIQPYAPRACTATIDNKKTGVQCYLRIDKDRCWITFRGTDSPKEWMSNLTFWKKTIPYDHMKSNIRVHTGFISAYKEPDVRQKILDAVSHDIHYVRISGHSRGAALAILCAVDIQYNFPDRDIEVIVFGCPRVGNKAFVQSYNKRVDKTVRVENGNDIVTKVPFALMGYRHAGARLKIGSFRFPFCFSAGDHYPHRYYAAFLRKYLPGHSIP